MGYNAMTGDPDNSLHDPGFTLEILEFSWANNVTTSDGRYLVPDNVQALQTRSCDSRAATEFGLRSYQQAPSTDVNAESGGSAAIWSARFSASTEHKRVSQGTSQYRHFYTSARAKCIQCQLSVNYLHSPVTITSSFAQAVSSLPLATNYSAYIRFINTYGTHFTSRVTMGAKMVIRSEFDETAFTRMQEEGLSTEIGAKASFLRFTSRLNTETTRERQQREMFERMRRDYHAVHASHQGSQPSTDGGWETRAQSTANSPYPVGYRLAPLTALFTAKFFPNMSSSALYKRRRYLTDAYNRYCSSVSGCRTPPPDRVPVRMTKTVSRFIDDIWVNCPPTYRLLSCGIENVRTSGPYDKERYAIPVSSTACKCHDHAGAVCVAWCTNTAVRYQIRTSPYTNGSTMATCSPGYKVRIKLVYSALAVSHILPMLSPSKILVVDR